MIKTTTGSVNLFNFYFIVLIVDYATSEEWLNLELKFQFNFMCPVWGRNEGSGRWGDAAAARGGGRGGGHSGHALICLQCLRPARTEGNPQNCTE